MNYKDKYIKYKSKYLQLQNQVGGSNELFIKPEESIKSANSLPTTKPEESIASIASTLPPTKPEESIAFTLLPTKPKSVPTQDQGEYDTCWAHAYARSFVRTFQVLDIITNDKVLQWYDLFYTILLENKTCEQGGNFNDMVYLFNYLKNNIDHIFTIIRNNIKCVTYYCYNKDIPILQFFTKEKEEEIKTNLRFLFENELIFLAIYPYTVNPYGQNLPTQAIKNMLDLRLQPALTMKISNSLINFILKKETVTYDSLRYEDSIESECKVDIGHSIVLRRWMKDTIEIKNSWGSNRNFAINDLKDLICSKNNKYLDTIIEFQCLMIDYNKLDKYYDFKIKVDNKKETYNPTIDPTLTFIENTNFRCSYDEYGFPNGENCQLQDYQNKTFFDGNLIHGLKNGQGIYTYPSGDVYNGNYKDDKKHGIGKYRHNDGSEYIGNWLDDKKHGKGIYKFTNLYVFDGDWTYDGDWIDDKKHGKGTQKYDNNSEYIGDWKDDKRNGKGIYKFKKFFVYDGDWIDHKKHGHGTEKYENGSEYIGDWKDDKKNGKGIYKYANGDVYEGNFENNKKHGHGKMTFVDGQVQEGNWDNDNFTLHKDDLGGWGD